MVIACLCHDLDHRGTNNKFQVSLNRSSNERLLSVTGLQRKCQRKQNNLLQAKAKNPLAQLYSTSILEQHHFNQCVMILNDNQILGNLSKDRYQEVITVVKDCILATDLDVYLKRRTNTFQLIKSDKVDWSQVEHKSQMQGMKTSKMLACFWPFLCNLPPTRSSYDSVRPGSNYEAVGNSEESCKKDRR